MDRLFDANRSSPSYRASSASAASQTSGVAEKLSIEELGIKILEIYTQVLCSTEDSTHLRRFFRYVPGKVCKSTLFEVSC